MTEGHTERQPRQPAPVLEIGGTHVTAALVDLAARRVVPGTVARQLLHGDAAARDIVDGILACARRLDAGPGARWGVAIPGPFDYARGVALYEGVAKFDALYGVDLGQVLTNELPAHPSRVSFLNDADAFTLGEWVAGAATGHDRAVGITLGTGVGSGFLARGRPVDDDPDIPPRGEVHLLTVDGRPLEDSVSRRAIIRRYARAAALPADTFVDVREIANRARAGDRVAGRVLDDVFATLGRVLAPWLARFDATVLVVGGSMAGSWDLIAGPLRDGLFGARPELRPRLVLDRARRIEDAALLGAAWHAVQDG